MGAFDYGVYKKGMNATGDSRLQAALTAYRVELAYNGFEKNLVLDSPLFGDAMDNRTKEFQASVGLKADGQLGVKSSTELFRKRVSMVEGKYNLPTGALGKQLLLESAYDPVAVGYSDPQDHGISQINLRLHPSVTIDEAYDPIFAIDWAGQYIRTSFEHVTNETNVMKAARAAYNIGDVYAGDWMLAGFPASGKVVDGIDWFKRATDYLTLVDKQVW